MVTISNQTAVRARVNSHRERLAHFCATRACLTRATRVNFHQQTPGAFSLVREHEKKVGPSGIVDALGEHSTRQTFDIEIFNGNQAVLINYLPRLFVMKVAALVANVIVEAGEQQRGFTPTVRSLLSSRNTSLQATELRLRHAKPARVFNRASIAERGKAAEPNVDPDHVCAKCQRRWLILDRKQCEPSPCLAFYGECFDNTLQWSVGLDSNRSDFRESQLVSVQRLADQAECHAVVTTCGLKSWKASFSTAANAAKESVKRVSNSAQGILKRQGVNRLDIRAICSDVLQLQILIEPRDPFALKLPGVASLLKRCVIQLAAHCKLIDQRSLLPFGRIDSVAECLDQGGTILSRRFSV